MLELSDTDVKTAVMNVLHKFKQEDMNIIREMSDRKKDLNGTSRDEKCNDARSKMKNKLLDGIDSRLDTVREKIIELEDGTYSK